ncbi:MAG: Na/Pi cotransporter family protein [Candidatus Sumerlaeia bacterium]
MDLISKVFSISIEVLELVGGLGLFLFGMHIMSEGIHKRAGRNLKRIMGALTTNRFMGMFTGLFTTSIIQSSSATTVLLVSLVNAGLVTLEQSIGVIMGANIGTTLTAWIVSFFGFKFKITMLALPAIAIAIPLFYHRKEKVREVGEILIGFGILFLGLSIMKESVPDLQQDRYEGVLAFVTRISNLGYLSVLIFIMLGTLLTIIVQSSSAAMAITMTMAFKGWIDFELAAAIVLGENIGTTITAYLASLGMNVNAKRTARAHMFFNIFGVLWMLAVFPWFIDLIDFLMPGDASEPANMPFHLSLFHTMFNIINSALMIGFVRHFADLVRKLVNPPVRVRRDDDDYTLPFVSGNLPEAAESNLISSHAEIAKMSELVHDMLLSLMNIIPEDAKDLPKIADEISDKEELTDQMQQRIVAFLTECTIEALSENQARRIYASQRITNELESIADSCENMAHLMRKRAKRELQFHQSGVEELIDYTSIVLDFLRYNADYLERQVDHYDIDRAIEMEKAINKQRNRLKKVVRKQLAKGADVRAELLFVDMVKNLEHIGDYSMNISQAMREIE